MGNVFPVRQKKKNKKQKSSKQLVDNYRPVSLLPIFSKIFEKMLFDSIYEFLDKNCLLNSNQST